MVKLAEHLLCFFGIKRSLVMPDNNFELKTCIAEVADLLVDFEVKLKGRNFSQDSRVYCARLFSLFTNHLFNSNL